MDNMAVEGYIMLNKKELQNFEMARFVFQIFKEFKILFVIITSNIF